LAERIKLRAGQSFFQLGTTGQNDPHPRLTVANQIRDHPQLFQQLPTQRVGFVDQKQ